MPDDQFNTEDVFAEADRILRNKSDTEPLSVSTYDSSGNPFPVSLAMQEKLLFYGRQALSEMGDGWHLRFIEHGNISDLDIVRMPLSVWIVTLEHKPTRRLRNHIYMETEE